MKQTSLYGGTKSTSVSGMNKFELNKSGVRELLKSAEMAEVIDEYTSRVADNAGNGYGHNVQTANRAVGRVFAESAEAERDNSENNTLLKALR